MLVQLDENYNILNSSNLLSLKNKTHENSAAKPIAIQFTKYNMRSIEK